MGCSGSKSDGGAQATNKPAEKKEEEKPAETAQEEKPAGLFNYILAFSLQSMVIKS